jgi:hypothetical protein
MRRAASAGLVFRPTSWSARRIPPTDASVGWRARYHVGRREGGILPDGPVERLQRLRRRMPGRKAPVEACLAEDIPRLRVVGIPAGKLLRQRVEPAQRRPAPAGNRGVHFGQHRIGGEEEAVPRGQPVSQRPRPHRLRQVNGVVRRVLPPQHLARSPKREREIAVEGYCLAVGGEGRVPGGAPVPLLAPQERLERGQGGRPHGGGPEHLDPSGASKLAQQPNRERVGQPVHPVGRVAQLDLGQKASAGDVERGDREPGGVGPGADQRAEHHQPRPRTPAQLAGGGRVGPAAPAADHRRGRHRADRPRAIEVA